MDNFVIEDNEIMEPYVYDKRMTGDGHKRENEKQAKALTDLGDER
jgi:hypothetical protein